jgi:putative hydrolase of the HAD superfamily
LASRHKKKHDSPAPDARLRTLAPWLEHPQSIRAILFDAGFTLLHPNPSIVEVVCRACARVGVNIEATELERQLPVAERTFIAAQHLAKRTWADNDAIARAWQDYFGAMIQSSLPDGDPDVLRRCLTQILADFDSHASWQLYDDVRPTLDALRGRYTLGVISDWNIYLGAILRELRLTGDFHLLVVSAISRRAKPDPYLFEMALRRADALGDYTLYVGDSYMQDVLGARAAGINPVLLDRRRRLDPTQIDCPVIHTLADLLRLLDEAEN